MPTDRYRHPAIHCFPYSSVRQPVLWSVRLAPPRGATDRLLTRPGPAGDRDDPQLFLDHPSHTNNSIFCVEITGVIRVRQFDACYIISAKRRQAQTAYTYNHQHQVYVTWNTALSCTHGILRYFRTLFPDNCYNLSTPSCSKTAFLGQLNHSLPQSRPTWNKKHEKLFGRPMLTRQPLTAVFYHQ